MGENEYIHTKWEAEMMTMMTVGAEEGMKIFPKKIKLFLPTSFCIFYRNPFEYRKKIQLSTNKHSPCHLTLNGVCKELSSPTANDVKILWEERMYNQVSNPPSFGAKKKNVCTSNGVHTREKQKKWINTKCLHFKKRYDSQVHPLLYP